MDFGTLKSRLLAQIGRAPSDLCYELVTAEVNETVRLAAMQATTSFSPVESYTLPTDFIEAVSVYWEIGSGSRRSLQAREPSAFDAGYSVSSQPSFYSVSDGVMRLNGATGGGTVHLRYYQSQADLSADSDTNPVLSAHPAIYVYGVLAHHAALISDQSALAVHFPAYERAVKMAQQADRARRQGGDIAPPTMRTTP